MEYAAMVFAQVRLLAPHDDWVRLGMAGRGLAW